MQRAADGFVAAKFGEMGVPHPTMDRILAKPSAEASENATAMQRWPRDLARMSMVDIGVFFAVLMVGFFYVWRRGDLDWVRAVSRERAEPARSAVRSATAEEVPL